MGTLKSEDFQESLRESCTTVRGTLEFDQTAVRVTSRWDSGPLNAEGIEVLKGMRGKRK